MELQQIVLLLLTPLVIATGASAYAQPRETIDAAIIGKVETIYVRESRNLFIEKKLLRKTQSRDQWIEVRFDDGAPRELFRMPADLSIARGDRVAPQAGDLTPRNMNL